MTIHSDWSRILLDECKEAFSKKSPDCSLDIGIIDGHLQLMRLDARMRTWECFVRNQFLKPIQSHYYRPSSTWGAPGLCSALTIMGPCLSTRA